MNNDAINAINDFLADLEFGPTPYDEAKAAIGDALLTRLLNKGTIRHYDEMIYLNS